MNGISLSVDGRTFPLPQCQALRGNKGNAETNGQKAIALVERAANRGELTNAHNQFIEATGHIQSFIQSLLPQVMDFAFGSYSEDEINALITQADNDALPLVRALIAATDAVIAEGDQHLRLFSVALPGYVLCP